MKTLFTHHGRRIGIANPIRWIAPRRRGDLAFIRNCQEQKGDEFKELPRAVCLLAQNRQSDRTGRFFCITFSHAPRRRSRYDGAATAKPQDRPPHERAYARTMHTPSPLERGCAQTDNRYSVTPTLAGDKGLNGQPGRCTGYTDGYAPTTRRAALRRTARALSIRLFVLRDEGAVPRLCAPRKRRAHAHALTHTHACTPHSELRNSEKSTRSRRSVEPATERRRERDPGVSTIRNARLVPQPISRDKTSLLHRRDTNSLANSCLVSIASRLTGTELTVEDFLVRSSLDGKLPGSFCCTNIQMHRRAFTRLSLRHVARNISNELETRRNTRGHAPSSSRCAMSTERVGLRTCPRSASNARLFSRRFFSPTEESSRLNGESRITHFNSTEEYVHGDEIAAGRQPARGVINLGPGTRTVDDNDNDNVDDDETMTTGNPTSERPSFFVSTGHEIHRCNNVASGSNATNRDASEIGLGRNREAFTIRVPADAISAALSDRRQH
ncbi:hypothetical protein DBV15_07538 [Temnothorax longispinosus]|uniref:Uncharacterized protein n=1 Tax=Temnothorax longispinosus TaxID=300112 RepID=A0A4V3S893_9HYME|nr:hypothetical protein DBV15_07538 [Temnothorax longispinosus]